MSKLQATRVLGHVSPGPFPSVWLAWLLLAVAGVLVACGGEGSVPATQPGGKRALPADFGTRKAVAYSPFRGANPDIAAQVVTRDNVLQDLGLLAQGGFTLIRTFDSSLPYVRLTLQAIKDNRINMKVQLGVKLYPTFAGADQAKNLALNNAEVAAGVALAKEFSDIVVAVAVGNETVTFGTVTLDQMAGYISTVRANVIQPITTGEYWDGYCGLRGNGPRKGQGLPATITNLIDYASIHVYPILQADAASFAEPWDSEQQAVPEARRAAAMMDAAIAFAQENFACARKYLDGQGQSAMPMVIGETGWQTVPTGNLTYLHHPVNQKMYYDRLIAWGADKTRFPSGPLNIYYFSAFDEPWKVFQVQGYNEDNWGLFNVQRQAKYVVQGLFPASQWDSGRFTPADATFAPTVVTPVVTANRYRVYADLAVAGEDIAPAVQWFGFDSPPNAFVGEGTDAALAAEGTRFLEIGPAPSTAVGKDYGWGALNVTTPVRADMSQFQASGRLNFSIRTTYPGKLMFGFGTSPVGAVFVVASNTNADGYGFVNDGTWRSVSIPISAFNVPGNTFNLSRVTNALVVADIYERTGNVRGSTTKVFIDNVFWSK